MEINAFSRSSLAAAIQSRGRKLSSVCHTLEKRVLLDASVAVDAGQTFNDVSGPDTGSGDDAQVAASHQQDKSEQQHTESEAGNSPGTVQHELVVIDLQLDDAQALVDDLMGQADSVTAQEDSFLITIGERSITLLTLGADDGLHTVTEFIQQSERAFNAVHLVSHGDAGGVSVGGEQISLTSLQDFTDGNHSAQLQSWQNHLAQDADILLYGCNTGYSLTGESFVEQVSLLTGADVAASDDPTGALLRGGDWELEQQQGEVETDIVFSKLLQGEWQGLLAATPSLTLDVPAEDFINEGTSFQITFDNLGTDTGFGPFGDLVVGPGLVIQDATGLGGSLTFETFTSDGLNWIDSKGEVVQFHPFDRAETGGIPLPPVAPAGSTWYAAELPFGSFTPDQPAYTATVTAFLDESAGAQVGVPIAISARGGFYLGEQDALNNPDVDPPVVGNPVADTITPTVLIADKTVADNDGDNNSVGDDNETVTGPSEEIKWTINVDLADNTPVENIVITDRIPDNFYYLGNVTVGGAAGPFTLGTDYEITSEPAMGTALGAQLVITFLNPVAGTTNADDIQITYTGYVPDVDANGDPIVINDGGTEAVINDVDVTGQYQGTTVTSDAQSKIITATSLAVQKKVENIADTGAPGFTPGDRLQYTLSTQISDYAQVSNLQLSDVLGDGLKFDPDSVTIEFFIDGATQGPQSMTAANINFTENPAPGNGTTNIQFDVSQEFQDIGLSQNGVFLGDLLSDLVIQGTTSINITFEAVILENYTGAPLAGTANETVDSLDKLNNQVTVSARLDNSTNQVTVDNNSNENVTVAGVDQDKTVFAINGDTNTSALDQIKIGDQVTFSITVDLSTLDVESLSITDYLPQPIFVASTPTFIDTQSGTNLPGLNEWGYGASTDFGTFPSGYLNSANVTSDSAGNSIQWDYPLLAQNASPGGTIQLLFTVEVQDQAFADGLFITNVSSVGVGTTTGVVDLPPEGAELEVLSPEIEVTKGIVSGLNPNAEYTLTDLGPVTFAPAGTPAGAVAPWSGVINSSGISSLPIDADLANVDAGDLVRFVITLENSGATDAYDVRISDNLPDGFAIPTGTGGTNLQVFTGAGDQVNFTGDLFSSGITLTDPADSAGTGGAIGQGRDPDNGSTVQSGDNIVVIIFDLVLEDSVRPNQVIENTAQLETFAGVNNGTDFTAGAKNKKWQDDALVQTLPNTVEKTRVSTSIVNANNSNSQAVIGEEITYRLTLTLAEGSSPLAEIVDRLDPGLEFVRIDSVNVSSTDVTSTVNLDPAGLAPSISGRELTFDLGDLTNSNLDNAVAETITVEYTVKVSNVQGNQSGTQRNNSARFFWDATDDNTDNPTEQSRNSAQNTRIIEPDLRIDKTLTGTPSVIDANDMITYQIVISHSNASDTDAFDLSFTDQLPAELNSYMLVSAVHSSLGDISGDFSLDATSGLLELTNNDLDLLKGDTITLEVSAIVDANIIAATQISNTATAQWTSLNGSITGERTGVDGPGGLNNYVTDDTFRFTTRGVIAQDKSVIASSIEDAYNGIDEAVIGESLIYAVTFLIPEGSVPLAQVSDNLPAGMEFISLDDVIAGGNLTSSLGDLNQPGTVNAVVTGDPQVVTFALGDINNIADNVVDENDQLTLVYTVRVTNVASNQAGTVLTNEAIFAYDVNNNGNNTDPVDQAAMESVDVTVLEPDIQVTKTSARNNVDNGDLVEYTITIENMGGQSGTQAYDVTFRDPLPPELTNVSFVAIISFQGLTADVSNFFDIVGGELVTTLQPGRDLPPGATITIEVAGTLENTLAGQQISNTATAEWTSLPDPDPNERTGTDGPTGLNNYVASATDLFSVAAPTLEKNLLNTDLNDSLNDNDEATIGEIVTFSVTATLPEAELTGVLVDQYGPGFEFISLESVTFSDPSSIILVGSITLTDDPTANEVTLDFGTLINLDTDNTTTESVTLTYRVRVLDIAANTAGSILTNNAVLRYDTTGDGNNNAEINDDAEVTLVEPEVLIEKELVSSNPSYLGGSASYKLTISLAPGATADAYDLEVVDRIPRELLLDTSSVQTTVVSGSATVNTQVAGDLFTANVSKLDQNTVIEITYDVAITTDPADVGVTVVNDAEVEYTSLPGSTDAIERRYINADDATTDIVAYDLVATKTDNDVSASPGDLLIYTIDYRNDGSGDALDVVIEETLPEYATFDAANSSAGWTLSATSPTTIYQINVGDLAPGASGTLQFAVIIDNPLPAGVEETNNGVQIFSNGGPGIDQNIENNDDTDETPLVAAPDYVIDKIENFADPAFPGETISWTIEVSNQGNQDGTGVVVTDTLPTGNYFSAGFTASNGGVVDLAAGTVTWAIGDLAAGDSISLTLTTTVDDSVPARIPQQVNSVSVTDDGNNGPDPTPDNNTDRETFDITEVDLSITKDDGGITTTPAGSITYTLNYANLGTAPADNVEITEQLPTYTTFDAANSDPRWVQNGNTLTLDLGTLAAGESGNVTFVVIVDDAIPTGIEEVLNSTEIAYDNGRGPDQNLNNNNDEDTTPIDAAPDYQIDKVENFNDPANPGDTIEWSITVTNAGNQDGTGVVVTDTLPDTSLLNSITADSGGVIDLVAGTVIWDVGDLAAGDSVTFTLSAIVNDTVPTTIPTQTNTVEVTDDGSNGPDPTPNNNTDRETFDITYVDLTIVKDDGGITATPGDVVVYTLTYTNNGTAEAEDVVITETLPDFARFDAANSAAGWVQNGNTFTLNVGNVAAGASADVAFAVIIDSPLPAGVTQTENTTSITDGNTRGPDQNPNDNTGTDTTPIDAAPDYQIDKVENFNDPANPGDTIEWSITVTNAGNQDGTGVVVTDTLPDTSLLNSITADSGGVIDLVAGTVIWDVGDLAAGDSVTFTLSAIVNDTVPTTIPTQTNTDEVTDDGSNGPDPTRNNSYSIHYTKLYDVLCTL
ncbi:isopeptide-forming domain-containing fimbrial protein [Microbulbifer sp. Q7]|uniref:isopeptide-forming domain-containing fimbrial protein n=1 Tax=Microbulbifer sp. Q7 TaxID=1785091 RepID=UPI00082B222A|nr:isopeptide-forming domain-containing fimbrial protein [Microbulbifer sp. Q7]